MKHTVIFLALAGGIFGCQNSPEKDPKTVPEEQVLIIIPAIEDKLYERPNVAGRMVAMVQPNEVLYITDTSDFFFYKVKLHRANEAKEGYILKASFATKPHLVAADSITNH